MPDSPDEPTHDPCHTVQASELQKLVDSWRAEAADLEPLNEILAEGEEPDRDEYGDSSDYLRDLGAADAKRELAAALEHVIGGMWPPALLADNGMPVCVTPGCEGQVVECSPIETIHTFTVTDDDPPRLLGHESHGTEFGAAYLWCEKCQTSMTKPDGFDPEYT